MEDGETQRMSQFQPVLKYLKMENLNIVSGQVLLKETQQPIPNLLVELMSKDVYGVFGTSGVPSSGKSVIRLGSKTTDVNGEFSISFEDFEVSEQGNTPWSRLKNRVRNLIIEIRAPEEEGKNDSELLLYKSDLRNAGAFRFCTIGSKLFSSCPPRMPYTSYIAAVYETDP